MAVAERRLTTYQRTLLRWLELFGHVEATEVPCVLTRFGRLTTEMVPRYMLPRTMEHGSPLRDATEQVKAMRQRRLVRRSGP